jgi:hypothetical protein
MNPQYDSEPPDDYKCPISREPMRDPVMMADGHSYEKTSIEQWLTVFKDHAFWRSPMTNAEFSDKNQPRNLTLKKVIDTWCEAHAVSPAKPPEVDIDKPPASEQEQVNPEQERINYGKTREEMRALPWFLALAETESTLKKPLIVTQHMQEDATRALSEMRGDESEASLWKSFLYGGKVQNHNGAMAAVRMDNITALKLLYYISEQQTESSYCLYALADVVLKKIAQHRRIVMLAFLLETPMLIQPDKKSEVIESIKAACPQQYLMARSRFGEPFVAADLPFAFQETCFGERLAFFLENVMNVAEEINPNLVLPFVLKMKCGEALRVLKTHFETLELGPAQANILLNEDGSRCQKHALDFYSTAIRACNHISEEAKDILFNQAVDHLDGARLGFLLTHLTSFTGMDIRLVQHGLQVIDARVQRYRKLRPLVIPEAYVAMEFEGGEYSKTYLFLFCFICALLTLMPFVSMGLVFYFVPYFVNANDCNIRNAMISCDLNITTAFNVTCNGLFRTCLLEEGEYTYTNEWQVGDTNELRDMREVARASTSRSGLILLCVFATAFLLLITAGMSCCCWINRRRPTEEEGEKIEERQETIKEKSAKLDNRQTKFKNDLDTFISEKLMRSVFLLVEKGVLTRSGLEAWINYAYDQQASPEFAAQASSQAIKSALYQTAVALKDAELVKAYKPDSLAIDIANSQAPQSAQSFWQRYNPFAKKSDLSVRFLVRR